LCGLTGLLPLATLQVSGTKAKLVEKNFVGTCARQSTLENNTPVIFDWCIIPNWFRNHHQF
jgi:hypothetical protein